MLPESRFTGNFAQRSPNADSVRRYSTCHALGAAAIRIQTAPPMAVLAAAINSTVVAGENPTVGSTVWLPAESVAPGR